MGGNLRLLLDIFSVLLDLLVWTPPNLGCAPAVKPLSMI